MRLPFLALASLIFSFAFQAPALAQLAPKSAAPQFQTREQQWRDDLTKQMTEAWRKDDFKTLEDIGEDFINHPGKSYNGKWKLASYTYALSPILVIDWPDEWNVTAKKCKCKSADPARYAEGNRRWTEVDDKLKAWSKLYPRSLIVPLARTHYAVNRAWFYRGHAYSSNVNPEAWPLFERYINEADATVKASAGTRFKDPAWYEEAVSIAVVAGWSASNRNTLYADMIQRAPTYAPAFAEAAAMLEPQWGGDYQTIDALIKSAQKTMSEKDGLEFYARVYWMYLGDNIPKEVATNWPMIRQGLDNMVERYPERINIDGAAQLACKFNDKEYFNTMARRLGTSDLYRNIPFERLDCNQSDFLPAAARTKL